MTCTSNFGIGIKSGRVPKSSKVILITSCRWVDNVISSLTYMIQASCRDPCNYTFLRHKTYLHLLPSPPSHKGRVQPQRQQHIRLRLVGLARQSVATWICPTQLHARRSHEGRQLPGILFRRRKAVSHFRRRRQNRQDLGLSKQNMRAGTCGFAESPLVIGI